MKITINEQTETRFATFAREIADARAAMERVETALEDDRMLREAIGTAMADDVYDGGFALRAIGRALTEAFEQFATVGA